MKPEEIARVCHEVNRAYCQVMGDLSQLPWEKAPDWQRNSAVNGVQYAIAHPEATPERMHESWCDQKLKEGWAVGPVKDPEKKEHPCLVDYYQLPFRQRVKDHIFLAVVRNLMDPVPGKER